MPTKVVALMFAFVDLHRLRIQEQEQEQERKGTAAQEVRIFSLYSR